MRTAGDGSFRFVNLPEDEFDVFAMSAGCANNRVRARSGDIGVEIRLVRTGRTLHARVLLPTDVQGGEVFGPRTAPPWRHLQSYNTLWADLLRQDPRGAEGPIPPEAEIHRTHVPLESPDIYFQVPLDSPPLWLALMACGRTIDVREASGNEEIQFEFDLAAAIPQVGGLRILVLDDASRGEPIPKYEVDLFADGRGPRWTAPGLPGDVVGPLLPGRYSAVVSAEGYQPATLENLTVEPGKATGPIEVRLRRK